MHHRRTKIQSEINGLCANSGGAGIALNIYWMGFMNWARIIAIFTVSALTMSAALGAGSRAQRGKDYGYVSNLKDEKEIENKELDLVAKPSGYDPERIKEKIFNDELSQEFRENYESQFGYTEAEQHYNLPTRLSTNSGVDDGSSSAYFIPDHEIKDRKRDFGNYMLRRLTEYHADNYAKNDPAIRPAYEFKDKVTNGKVEVAPGYKVDAKYSLAGNSVNVKFQNPYVRSGAKVDLGGTSQAVREATMNVGREVTRTVNLDSYYKYNLGQVSLVGTKRLTSRLSTSLTGAMFVNYKNYQRDDRGNLLLVWNY